MEPSILATLLSLGSGVILGLAASGIRALLEPSLRPVTSGQFGKLRLSLRRARTGKMRDKTDFDGRCTNSCFQYIASAAKCTSCGELTVASGADQSTVPSIATPKSVSCDIACATVSTLMISAAAEII